VKVISQVYDANENVVSLTKAITGKLVAQYDYNPFGETLQENGEVSRLIRLNSAANTPTLKQI
jgi:hypothetical protein